MANQNPGRSGHGPRTNPLLFTANTSSPFDKVFASPLAMPAPQPVNPSSAPAPTNGGPPPALAAPTAAPPLPTAAPPPAGPPPPYAGGGGLLNAFRAVPRSGGRFGTGASFPAPAAAHAPATAPVSVFNPVAEPPQQLDGVPDLLHSHLSHRQPAPADPSGLAPLRGPPAQSVARPPPTAQSVFAVVGGALPAPATASGALGAATSATVNFPTTAPLIAPAAGQQFSCRPSMARPSQRPPPGAVPPPPPKGGAAAVTMRRGSTRCQYAAPPGLAVATPEMTPFATPRGSIAEPGPVMLPLMASMAEPDAQGFEMSPAPAPVSPLVFHWFYAKSVSGSVKSEQQQGQPEPEPEPEPGQKQEQEQRGAPPGGPGGPPDWQPFSRADSALLEREYQAGAGGLVAVLGRRYDVDVVGRSLLPVYWECAPGAVRRCSWFSRGVHESKFVPYEEHVAEKLEEIYEESSRTGQWHRDVQLGEEGYVVLHSPGCLVHHPGITHAWEEVTMPDDPSRPRQMRRGWDMVEGASTPADEPDTVNHLVFVVHGIGSWCDLKFRKVTECVDDMRTMAAEMAGSHFGSALAAGRLGRVEFLPISWHHALHGAAGGLDEALRLITLPSIPLLREFTNDTIVDVLYYTSPIFCQVILRTVGDDINSIYRTFCERNPEFSGSVSVAGHSLGSLILFDLLSNQTGEAPDTESAPDGPDEPQLSEEERYAALLRSLRLEQHADTLRQAEVADPATLRLLTDQDVDSLGLPLGARRRLLNWRDKTNNTKPGVDTVTVSYDTTTGQPAMHYPQLAFKPACFFGMGSPIALFLRIRGVSQLGAEFRLPTCANVFNIYHPFDPVSFRIEPLIDASNVRRRPVLVPHHKGRKRMHLEIKEQVVRMGTELKQRLMSSLQSTIGTVYSLGWMSAAAEGRDGAPAAVTDPTGEPAASQQQLQQQQQQQQQQRLEEPTGPVGALNGGRRVDYVLQERPFESLNEYVFAFQSHLCYWDSEDTLLMILKETLRESGIEADKVQQRAEPASEAEVAAAAAAAGTVDPANLPSPASAAAVAPAGRGAAAAAAAAAVPPAPVPIVVTAPGAAGPPLPGGGPARRVPAAPATRAVGGRPLYLPATSGGPVGMDPTVERKEGAAPPPPPPTAGFRRS